MKTVLSLLCVVAALASCVSPVDPIGAPPEEADGFPMCAVIGCDDGNPCTDDVCRSWGCNHWPMPIGTLCTSDGSYGYCVAGAVCDTRNGPECLSNADCDDGIACTVDVCAIVAGSFQCQNSAANGGAVCYVGACEGTCFAPSWDGQHEYPGKCGGCE